MGGGQGELGGINLCTGMYRTMTSSGGIQWHPGAGDEQQHGRNLRDTILGNGHYTRTPPTMLHTYTHRHTLTHTDTHVVPIPSHMLHHTELSGGGRI